MTTEEFAILLLIISLVLGLIAEVMPDYAADRSKRYVRPKKGKARAKRW